MSAILQLSGATLMVVRTAPLRIAPMQKARIHDIKLLHLHELLHSIKHHPLQLIGLKQNEINPIQAGFENFAIAATDLQRKIASTGAGVSVMASKVKDHDEKVCWLCGGGHEQTPASVGSPISLVAAVYPKPGINPRSDINRVGVSTKALKHQPVTLNMRADNEDMDL